MCVFLLHARVSLTNDSLPFQFSLLSIFHFSLQDHFSFPFLPRSLPIRMHHVLSLLVLGLPLVCWFRSPKWIRSRRISSSEETFAMSRGSIWCSWRRRVEAWLAVRASWNCSVSDTNRWVTTLFNRCSLSIRMRSAIASRIWCSKGSNTWRRAR